jgi:hypothetical protein
MQRGSLTALTPGRRSQSRARPPGALSKGGRLSGLESRNSGRKAFPRDIAAHLLSVMPTFSLRNGLAFVLKTFCVYLNTRRSEFPKGKEIRSRHNFSDNIAAIRSYRTHISLAAYESTVSCLLQWSCMFRREIELPRSGSNPRSQ